MKSKIQWIFLLFVLVTLCSCGGTSSSEQSKIQHEKKPQTVNAIFKNSETSVKTNRLENDFIRIWPNYVSFSEPLIWMQENVDGTEKKELALENISYVLWLTNDWIYYSCGEKDDTQREFRIPIIHKGRKNDVTKIEWSCNNILKYDGKSEEITSVLTNTDLQDILEQIEDTSGINLIDESCYYCINAPYTYKDRLYIQVHTEAGARAFTQTSGKNVLLSAPFTNLEQWEIENDLTKYCLEQGMGDESPGTTIAAVIEEVYDGKALVAIVHEAEEPSSPYQSSPHLQGYEVIYNIDTGEIEKLEDEDYRVCQCYYY